MASFWLWKGEQGKVMPDSQILCMGNRPDGGMEVGLVSAISDEVFYSC